VPGARVNELRGEKVDIVEWREDSASFISAALSPARVKEVRLDEEEMVATVIVPDYQLSLAIGKEGQNARLAARLSGYKIDIRSESQDLGLDLEESEEDEASPQASGGAAVADKAAQPVQEAKIPTPAKESASAAEDVTSAGADEPATEEPGTAEETVIVAEDEAEQTGPETAKSAAADEETTESVTTVEDGDGTEPEAPLE